MKIVIVILVLLLIPTVNAWKWDTHQNIIEYVYLNLPLEVQQQLNLTKLKEGAVIPDRDFEDHRSHHYPNSLKEAEKWLNNNTDLSLNIGIASHYITDSYAAPHNIAGENYKQHAQFEKQVSKYYPSIECKDYGLSLKDLGKATKNSKDWDQWLKTKNKEIPQKEVDESTKMLFSIVLQKLDTTCINKTEIKEVSYFTKDKIIVILAITLIGLYFLYN